NRESAGLPAGQQAGAASRIIGLASEVTTLPERSPMDFYLSPDSYWLHSTERPPAYPPLSSDIATDVVVIGAGITGLTAADFLTRAGRNVTVIEAGRIGSGTTGGTSAHLDAHPEEEPRTHIKDFGEEAARTFTQARLWAIDHIER